ncbi:polyprenyl diphosphate synthase [Pyrolobus fumarii]|nr:polyprenyl diphosphate synthase [Pyrolobus fumarii]
MRAAAARLLFSKLKHSRLPSHVAIIPDGNRRWARRRGLPAWVGHLQGYKVMKRVLTRLWELGVRHITIYALSRENCTRRPREELTRLYELLVKALRDLRRDHRVTQGLVRPRVIGDMSLVPDFVVEEIHIVEKESHRNAPHTLNICVCYSGRWEILEAVRKIAISTRAEPNTIDEDTFTRLLPMGDVPPPDLLIRTGGELRLSNFLLWHVAYTELYFTRRLWPDFDDFELAKALLSYSRRERRFGA